MTTIASALIEVAQKLARAMARLKFAPPVAYVYNPLDYAWAAHEAYLRTFGDTRKRVVFLGMNPGPFGMMQTGVPFGEVVAVRDWMKLVFPIGQPKQIHPKRPVEGFACPRSEVSGRRLWGLFAKRFGSAQKFFDQHFVANYCPLAFLDEGGRNLTPDRLRSDESARLFAACDEHLRQLIASLQPERVIGIGDFAERRARLALDGNRIQFGKILHPSPASPAANQGWAAAATQQLEQLGVW